MKNRMKLLLATAALGAVVLAGCSSATSAAVETVEPTAAAEIIETDSGEVVLDIRTPEEFKRTVDELREKTGGKPIWVKLAAGAIEDDL